MIRISKKDRGEMLIEIVVAIGIIALVLVGVSDLMTRSARVVTFQRQRTEALAIAEKILIDYRELRDADPQGFYDTVTGTVLDPCEVGKPYVCTVAVEKTLEATLITITAQWTEGEQNYNVSLSQTLIRNIR